MENRCAAAAPAHPATRPVTLLPVSECSAPSVTPYPPYPPCAHALRAHRPVASANLRAAAPASAGRSEQHQAFHLQRANTPGSSTGTAAAPEVEFQTSKCADAGAFGRSGLVMHTIHDSGCSRRAQVCRPIGALAGRICLTRKQETNMLGRTFAGSKNQR